MSFKTVPNNMSAMVLEAPLVPLKLKSIPTPRPQKGQVLIRIHTCGVCRTDLHIVEGDLAHPRLPLVLGHQIVGTIVEKGVESSRFEIGQRVGVPWLGKSCQKCSFCLSHKENLCDDAEYTGYQINGGFAQYCVANEAYCFSLPDNYTDLEVAPLLCGGLIGFRALSMAKTAKKIGFYGFGSSAHILIQVACYLDKEVFVFTRKGDKAAQDLAKNLGAYWTGSSEEAPPEALDAAIIFAPIGDLIPTALKAVNKGGSVICAGIHMSDIPSFHYEILYGERILRSVTNLTRQDAIEFFKIASKMKIHTHVTSYPLEKANQAIQDLQNGKITGSAVISIL